MTGSSRTPKRRTANQPVNVAARPSRAKAGAALPPPVNGRKGKGRDASLRPLPDDRFRALIENSADTIVLLDATGSLQWASPSISRNMDSPFDEEFLGRGAFEFIHPEDQPEMIAGFQRLLREPDKDLLGEFRVRRRDGSWIWIEASAKNLLNDPRVSAIVCNYRNVTDRRTAEDALRSSERRSLALLENSTDMIALLAADGTIQWASSSTSRHLGYDLSKKVVGANFFEFIHPGDREHALRQFTAILNDPGGTAPSEYRARHADGGWRWIEAVAKNLLVDEAVQAVVVNYRDITDRKLAQDSLEMSEEHHRSLIGNASDIIMVLEPSGSIRYMSPSIELVSGFTPDEVVSSSMFALVHPDDLAGITAAIAKAVANVGVPQSAQFRVRHKNGEWRYLEGVGRALIDRAGAPFGVINLRDVTDRVRADEALRDSEARKGTVLETSLDCIISIDHEGKVTEFNPAAERTFGYSREQALGHEIAEIIVPPSLRKQHRKGFARYLATGDSRLLGKRIELTGMRVDGSEFPLELAIARVPSDGPPAFTGYVRDISERKQAEEALQKSADSLRELTSELERRVNERTAELKQINEELETFAFSVSHDLRTQLRAMRGFGQAVLEDYGDEMGQAARDFTHRVVETTNQTDELIQDILDYSRLSRADVQLEPLTLALVLPDALRQMASEVDARAARVEVDPTTHVVMGHYQTLVQALTNLIGNAIKFVSDGNRPRVKIHGRANGEWVRITVEDNGIGIAAKHQQRIFGMFERLHGVEDYPGTGIGLAIVRRAVERMGGRVGVHSKVGEGSSFWLELRAAAPSIEQPPTSRKRARM